MAIERASIFDDDDLDVSEFAPTSQRPDRTGEADRIKSAALQKGFISREGQDVNNPPSIAPQMAPRRRYTTGRNRQLNMKVTDEALKRFYALADAGGWVLGETFEHAVMALERELAREKA
jgi:hypothetical protein